MCDLFFNTILSDTGETFISSGLQNITFFLFMKTGSISGTRTRMTSREDFTSVEQILKEWNERGSMAKIAECNVKLLQITAEKYIKMREVLKKSGQSDKVNKKLKLDVVEVIDLTCQSSDEGVVCGSSSSSHSVQVKTTPTPPLPTVGLNRGSRGW